MGGILTVDEHIHENNQAKQATNSIMAENNANGYCLKGHYIPEDVLIVILSHVDPKDLLKCKQVCRVWNHIVKTHALWNEIHLRHCNKPAKLLPWQLFYAKFGMQYFDHNFIRNGNGEEKYDHWIIKPVFSGDGFQVEDEPISAQPLPKGIPEFNGKTSCFATSYGLCSKQQIIKLSKYPGLKKIIDTYKPTILASEWSAPRMDCSSTYTLKVFVLARDKSFKEYSETKVEEQWTDGVWKKVQLVIDSYPDDVDSIIFQHSGQDLLFWKGRFGSKMAGACLQLSFDSLKGAAVFPTD